MCECKKIASVEELIKETENGYKEWGLGKRPWFPWFRGEPDGDTPLVPRLFRPYYKNLFDGDYYENRLLQHFRARALAFGKTPHRDETDQWLFLAQHVGLPTRLLDWTGSLLGALYFALQEENPIVWMLNPFCLNNMVLGNEQTDKLKRSDYNIYGLPWILGEPGKINAASENIRLAWGEKEELMPTPQVPRPIGTTLPVALSPSYVHSRIPAQKGHFTIHGREEGSICELLDGKEKYVLKKYIIDAGNDKQGMLDQLEVLGVSAGTLFPDLDGLAKGLTELFRPDLAIWIKRGTQEPDPVNGRYFGFSGLRAEAARLYAKRKGATQEEVRNFMRGRTNQKGFYNMLDQAIKWGHLVVTWYDPTRGKVFKLKYNSHHTARKADNPPNNWKELNEGDVPPGVEETPWKRNYR